MSTTTLIIHLIIGIFAALAFIFIARRCGIAWEKRIYAVGLFIAALIYMVFAVFLGASSMWRSIELMGLGLFTLLAVLGLRVSTIFLAAGWAVHGLWDGLLHMTRHETFVPEWYPVICLGFDLIVAIYIVTRFKTQSALRQID